MTGPAATGEVRLEANGPWDSAAALALLVAHTVPGAETTVDGVHRRLLRLGDDLVAVELHFGDEVVLRAPAAHLDDALPVVRRWFDLDAGQGDRNGHLAGDPLLAPLVAARPGLRVTGHPNPFESLLGVVIGQQVSLAAARTVTGRLVAAYGTPVPGGLTAFPTADQLADRDADELRAACGFMSSRARTLLTVARAVVDGLDLTPGQDPDALARTRRELLALPGIGPWTVDFLCLRALGDPDAFPAGDLVLKRQLGVTTERAARERAAEWTPYRSLAAMHLWTAGAYLV